MWKPSAELQTVLDRARAHGKSVVLATGVFDILHKEHRTFLRKARAAGDVLIIGIETDARVKELKGNDRPVNSEKVRVAQLEALKVSEAVFLLPTVFHSQEDYVNLIEKIQPRVLAVSSHSPYMENKRVIMEQFGGEVRVVHEHNPAISTTQILEKRRSESLSVKSHSITSQ